MLLKMSTCAALSFMSTKGNQEGHKSDSIKYVKMNALWHYFSTMHAYTSDSTPERKFCYSPQSKKDINEIIPFFETIKTQHLCPVPKRIYIKMRFSSG